MPRKLFITIMLFMPLLALSQPADLSGTWRGKLSQNSGGYASDYDFALFLEVKSGYIDGRSFVAHGDVSGEMELIGMWKTGDVLYFREHKVLKSIKPDLLEWCYKTAELRLVKTPDGNLRLEGPWWGESVSGICIPGYIRLEKVVPRA